MVWGTGNPTREFLYVDDAARGIVLATEIYDKPEPINLGTSQEVSIRDLVATIAHLTKFEGRVTWDATYPDGQPRRKLDVERARQELGFVATIGPDEGLKQTVEWYEASRRNSADSGTRATPDGPVDARKVKLGSY